MVHVIWIWWLHRPHGLALGWHHHHHRPPVVFRPPQFCTPTFTVCAD